MNVIKITKLITKIVCVYLIRGVYVMLTPLEEIVCAPLAVVPLPTYLQSSMDIRHLTRASRLSSGGDAAYYYDLILK